MSIKNGAALYASQHPTSGPVDHTSLAGTAVGRGRLRLMAKRGDADAKAALRAINTEAPPPVAEYDA